VFLYIETRGGSQQQKPAPKIDFCRGACYPCFQQGKNFIMSKPNPNCPCASKSCPRHGDCKECRAFHKENGGKTACQRLADAKKTAKTAK